MKVRNNLANPYMLCNQLIPPGGVADVNDRELEAMKNFENFKKLFDSKSLEVVGVQAVSPGFESENDNSLVQVNKINQPSDNTVKEPKVNDFGKLNKK